ncbi:MAG: hypothetical protein ACLRRI_06695 [Oscillospiraceae bacterium]
MDKKVFPVYMGNPDNHNHAELELPAAPWELLDALDKLRLEDGQQLYWQVEDMGRYDFLAPHLDGYDLYQFNALAEQLSTFSNTDAVAFEGLVEMEIDKLCRSNGGELTLPRVLDLAYSADCCHVVQGITDDAALGQFYLENDFLPELENVPDSVLKMLDYEKIGRSMREGEGGVFTPHGYVMQESELRQAPPNLGRPPRKPPYMIYFLCVSDVRAVKLYLPAKQAELDAVLDCLEVDSWQEVRLEDRDAAMPEMWFFTDMACDSMEQVNRFAQCLAELDMNRELVKFKAVAGHLDIRNLDDALALAEHLSEYALEPGIHALEGLAREELSVIVGDPDGDLLMRYLNMDAYGAALLWRDKGVFSDYGYICRPDGQPLQLPRQGMDMTMQ